MTKIKTYILLIVAFVFFNPIFSESQEASLEDTKKWIQGNMSFLVLINAREKTHALRGVSINNGQCILQFNSYDFYWEIETSTTVDFSKLVLSGIKANDDGSEIFLSHDLSKPGIFSSVGTGKNNSNLALDGNSIILDLSSDSAVSADRFVKAFKHLAELCGSTGVKDDLF